MTITLEHPRYHFDRWLAAGGMGEVWCATDTLLDREVAVKVLRRELAEDPVLRARFAAEARHAGALQHPHVASVLDYGEIQGEDRTPLPFLVMELVEGQPLSALLDGEQPLAPKVAAELIAQAAEGIEAAHAIGIVHRDVKPSNLLVTAEGQVKVTDFGVARAADTASLTVTGHLIGTPHYLAPEQAVGESATPVSDVYSLGIVLYECLTGRKPFVGESPVSTAVMQIQTPLPAFPAGVPERLQEITRVATAKKPAQRFRSAGAMAAALRDESPDTRSFVLPEQAQLEVVADERHRRELLSVRRVLAVLVLLLLLSGGAWAMVASDDPDDPADATTEQPAEGSDPELVRVRASEYVGDRADDAAGRLRRLGLEPVADQQRNPGGEVAGTVAAVSPTGLLEPGSRVRLTVWGPPPAPQEPASGPSASGSAPVDKGTPKSTGRPGPSAGNGGGPTKGQGSSPAGPAAGPGNSHAGGNGKSQAGGNGKGKGKSNGKGGGKPGKGGKR